MKPLMDEDYAYEQERQRRLDAMTEAELNSLGIIRKRPPVIIGSALPKEQWIQHYAHRDPAPKLYFQEDIEHRPSIREALGWVALAILVIIANYIALSM